MAAPPAAPAGRHTHPLLSRTTAAKPTLAPAVDLFADDDGPGSAPTPAPAPVTAALPTAQPAPLAPAPQPTAPASPPAPTAGSNIFDLDFRAPTPSSARPQNAKADIMSLYSSGSSQTAPPTQSFFAPPSQPNPHSSWNGGGTSTAPPIPQTATQAPIAGGAGWGGLQMDQSAWGAPVHAAQPTAGAWGGNVDPWASSGGFGARPPAPVPVKKEERDPFANIWQ